jgi:hypothetical protein
VLTLADGGKELLWVEIVIVLDQCGWCHLETSPKVGYTLQNSVGIVIAKDFHFCSQLTRTSGAPKMKTPV